MELHEIIPTGTSPDKALEILEAENISTTSWVLTCAKDIYGEAWAEGYIESIKDKTCEHGMVGPCPYCKWGTN